MHIRKTDLEKAWQVKAIIDKEYFRQLTYKELACLVGIGVNKLPVAFQIITSKKLYEYYSMIRVERAKYLLENTDFKIEVIAEKVGLDRTNLNKQFKKIYGVSPSAWRNQVTIKDRSFYRGSG